MTEILTESFCERCGTRYTFESARPRVRLKGVKTLSRGLKNFVLSDDTSMDEAMAAARSETDREATAHQLDAFHKTFNFCMSCRQYTCPNCWNEAEARCLSCAPLALSEAVAVIEDLPAFGHAVLIGDAASGNGTVDHDQTDGAWTPTVEPEPAIAGFEEEGAPGSMIELEAAPSATEPAPSEVEIDAVAAGTPAVPADPAGKAAAQTSGLLRRFRPGQSLDAELDAFERERDHVFGGAESVGQDAPPMEQPGAAAELEPVAAAAETEPAPIAAAEPEPVAELEPGAAAEPVREPGPEPLAVAAGADLVEQPTWRITAPDATPAVPTPGLADSSVPVQATGAPAAPVNAAPQWPASPQWPSSTPAAGLPFLGRPATPEGGIEALWAASNQELVTAAPPPQGRAASGIQPCISCGLSLSATARFCRRCGTLQGR